MLWALLSGKMLKTVECTNNIDIDLDMCTQNYRKKI